jgi:hypothetical protein
MSQITVKTCGKCKTEKNLDSFGIDNKRKDGKNCVCKECRKHDSSLKKSQRKKYFEDYYQNNKEKIILNQSVYYAQNKDVVKIYKDEYYLKNLLPIAEKAKKYREENKSKLSEEKRIYSLNRRKIDPIYLMKGRLRSLVGYGFRNSGFKKTSKTRDILGCSYNDFMIHIESQFKDGMNWKNRSEWHIDHIIPISSAKTEDELLRLSHYLNLRPLWAKENIIKGSKMPKQSIVNSIELRIAKEKGVKLTQGSIFDEC